MVPPVKVEVARAAESESESESVKNCRLRLRIIALAAVWSTYLAFLFLQSASPNDYQINGSDAL